MQAQVASAEISPKLLRAIALQIIDNLTREDIYAYTWCRNCSDLVVLRTVLEGMIVRSHGVRGLAVVLEWLDAIDWEAIASFPDIQEQLQRIRSL